MKYLFPGAQRNVPVGSRVADLVFNDFIIELKSGVNLGGRGARQLAEYTRVAAEEGRQVVYVFLEEPSARAVSALKKAGVSFFTLF